MPPLPFTGPGILWVTSKITQPEHLSEKTYLTWYDEEHIPEILTSTPVKSLIRLRNHDATADRPYLVTCPLEDMADVKAFKGLQVKWDSLPDEEGNSGGSSHDCADLDYRFYQLIQKFEPHGGEATLGNTKTIGTGGFDLGPDLTEQEFHDWYDKEHLLELQKVPGYLRTTRYKLLLHRTNGDTRSLKGLPSRPQDEAEERKEPPLFHAVHEFSVEGVDHEAAMKTIETDWAKRILANCPKQEYTTYQFEKSFGDGKLFH